MGSTVGSAKNKSNCFFCGLHIEVTKTKENLSPKQNVSRQCLKIPTVFDGF